MEHPGFCRNSATPFTKTASDYQDILYANQEKCLFKAVQLRESIKFALGFIVIG